MVMAVTPVFYNFTNDADTLSAGDVQDASNITFRQLCRRDERKLTAQAVKARDTGMRTPIAHIGNTVYQHISNGYPATETILPDITRADFRLRSALGLSPIIFHCHDVLFPGGYFIQVGKHLTD
jgi:hypothetical protein